MRTSRQTWLALAGLSLLLLTAGCRTEDNSIPDVEIQDRIIQTATLLEDPSMVLLTWDAVECERFLDVIVELDDTYANLLIKTEVDIGNCPPPSFAQIVADLGEPLGERRIWDRAFGDTVALE